MEKYKVFYTDPIDHWEDFIHIKYFGDLIKNMIKENPLCDLTYSDIWHDVLLKIHWMWCISSKTDKIVRSPDIYIYPCSCLNFPILYKADNNGTVFLIISDSFDVENEVRKIPTESGGKWEEYKE